MYDFIGDVHGRYDSLVQLLTKLGYTERFGVWSHPNRKAFFLGDLIDNGPKIKQTLDLVKNMVTEGSAMAIMGNHEFNFVCYHIESKSHPGEYLRPRNDSNTVQCLETIRQLGTQKRESYLEWLISLPLFWEEKSFRAVHACWDKSSINHLQTLLSTKNTVDNDTIHELFNSRNKPIEELKITLKGPKFKLPNKYAIKDKYGETRSKIRAIWWDLSKRPQDLHEEFDYHSFIKDLAIPTYAPTERPVFFGHYYKSGNPDPYLTAVNAQCLDFGIENGSGHLVAYRFNNESQLSGENLHWVPLNLKDLEFT